jgi:hypothetical protein
MSCLQHHRSSTSFTSLIYIAPLLSQEEDCGWKASSEVQHIEIELWTFWLDMFSSLTRFNSSLSGTEL